MSVRPHGPTLLPLDGFHEIKYMSIFRKAVEKIPVSLKPDKNHGYYTKDRYTFMIISRLFLLIMRNVSDKSCRENQNTHFVFSDFFLRKSCRL